MAWFLLVVSGIEEMIAAIAMKYVDGTKKKLPIIVMVVGFALSFYCLSKAMQVLSAGVAYAVWTGIGIIGITAVSFFWFKERLQLPQLLSLLLIIVGVVGLRLTS
ncbi:multidrug efflux SMR transporter [Bacillus swezeyi]|uniref:DMT family transporter n=1 Tax=Bacillus swezeyi TaxID=1925020 RepID=UPI002E24B5D0|nr:multidrug efflux SMR transporter [Bacillus swezeyi]